MPSNTSDRRFGLGGSYGIKAPVDLATTGNITLSGEQTIDGVATNESRVLVWQQTNPVENGLYDTSTGSWTRCIDANGNRDLKKGTLIAVTGGTQAGLYFHITSANPIQPGTLPMVWEQDLTNTASALRTELATIDDTARGAGQLGYTPNYVGAIGRLLGLRLDEWVNLTDFIPTAEHAAIYAYTSTYDCAPALQAAIDTRKTVHACSGLFGLGATSTFDYQGGRLIGSGWGSAGTRFKRLTDTSFGPLVSSPGGGVSEHTIIENIKFEDYSGLSDTNTSPLVSIGCNDWIFRSCWILNGYKGLYLPEASSNGLVEGCTFEACRKQGIDTYSAGLLKIIGNTFWKCTADISNPADRSAAITFRKNPVYSFGTFDVNLIGNYFFETVYGHHIHAEGVEGLQIDGNFLTVASQVDAGQRDDIYLKDATRVEIVGNTANSVLNSYVTGYPAQRGSRYCVNIDTGCSDIQIGSNGFRAGISGTINDPNNSAVIFGSNTGIKLANVTTTDKRVNNYHRRYVTADLTIGITFGGASTGWGYTSEARLQRDGDWVRGTIQIQITTKGSATGAFLITGLPYAAANVAGLQFVGGLRLNGLNVTPNGGRVLPNTTTCTVDKITAGVSAQLTDADFPAGAATVTVEINYPVS